MLEYCVHIEIQPDPGKDPSTTRVEVLDQVQLWVKDSLTRRRIQAKQISKGLTNLGDGNEIEYLSDSAGADTLDTVIWTRPHEFDPTLNWKSFIRLATLSSGTLVLDLTVELVSTVFEARSLPYTSIRPPRLVKTLLSAHRCYGEPTGAILTVPTLEADEVKRLLVPLLESPSRIYPVVVVAPTSDPTSTYLLDPSRVQEELAGLARVYRLTQRATFTLTEEVGHLRSCFDGGARIYWPGFDRGSNPYRHHLFLGEDIEASASKALERIFRVVRENATLRYAEAPEITRVRNAIWSEAERIRSGKFNDLQAQLSESAQVAERQRSEFTDKLRQEVAKSAELSEFIGSLRRDNDKLRDLLRQFSAQLKDVQDENGRLKRSIRELGQQYVEQGKVETSPTSVYDAAIRAQSRCPNLLTTGGALDIARRSDYSDPEKVYAVLIIANEVSAKIASGVSFGHHWGEEIVSLAGIQGGFSTDFKAHLSMTAKGAKFRAEYEVTYLSAGRMVKRLIEPHILLQRRGNVQEAARIFLDWDANERKLVVSRIGMHPKNLSS
jgi:hypothetical protein